MNASPYYNLFIPSIKDINNISNRNSYNIYNNYRPKIIRRNNNRINRNSINSIEQNLFLREPQMKINNAKNINLINNNIPKLYNNNIIFNNNYNINRRNDKSRKINNKYKSGNSNNNLNLNNLSLQFNHIDKHINDNIYRIRNPLSLNKHQKNNFRIHTINNNQIRHYNNGESKDKNIIKNIKNINNINININNINNLNNNRYIPFAYNIDNEFEISKNNYKRYKRPNNNISLPTNSNDNFLINNAMLKNKIDEDKKFEEFLKESKENHLNKLKEEQEEKSLDYSIFDNLFSFIDDIYNLREIEEENDYSDYSLFNNPLDEEAMNNLPIIKLHDIDKLSDVKKRCVICMDDFEFNDETISLPCVHIFHSDCIKKWFKRQNTCPICKYKIEQENND